MAVVTCGLDVPEWSRYYISPTYLSTDLITPQQVPFRCTIPRFNCLAREQAQNHQLDRRPQRKKLIHPLRPDNNQPTVYPCWANTVQPSYHTKKGNTLNPHHLRLSDEMIAPPTHCTNMTDLMKEETQLIKEPMRASKNEVFPKGRGEYQTPQQPNEIRQTEPLSESTKRALEDIARRRYHISTYMNDYTDPEWNKEELERLKKSIEEEENERSKLFKPSYDLKEGATQGTWPSWPASINKIICKQTGRVMEKDDLDSMDDDNDQRRLKFKSNKEKRERKVPTKPGNKKPFNARTDITPITNFYLCGCGPYTTGIRRTGKDLKSTAYHEKAAVEMAAKEEAENAQPDWMRYNPEGGYRPYRKLGDNDTMMFDEKRHPYKPTEHKQQFEDFLDVMKEKWYQHGETEAADRFDVAHYLLRKPNYDIGRIPTSQKEVELRLEDIELEDKGRLEDMLGRPYYQGKNEDKLKYDNNQLSPIKYPKTSEHNLPLDKYATKIYKKPPDPSVWSLDLKRKDEKLTAMLKSAAPVEKQQEDALEQMQKNRAIAARKIESYAKEKGKYMVTSNPHSLYFTPEIKLPPTVLWEAVEPDGTGPTHRYGMPFRTIAAKRYKLNHPEPVPDLRDCRHKYKKEVFLGYHSNVFR